MSRKLVDFTKQQDGLRVVYDKLDQDVDNTTEDIESDVFFRIKNSIGDLHGDVDKMDAESLLLQRQITTLKKEKTDLVSQLNALNVRLDNLEKELGINIAAKRAKKKI